MVQQLVERRRAAPSAVSDDVSARLDVLSQVVFKLEADIGDLANCPDERDFFRQSESLRRRLQAMELDLQVRGADWRHLCLRLLGADVEQARGRRAGCCAGCGEGKAGSAGQHAQIVRDPVMPRVKLTQMPPSLYSNLRKESLSFKRNAELRAQRERTVLLAGGSAATDERTKLYASLAL